MKDIKAVIFDMDGLMLDTEIIAFMSFRDAFKEFGYTLDEPFFETLIGRNIKGTKECILDYYGKDLDFDSILIEINKKTEDYIIKNGVKTKKGLIELLEYLKENDYKMAVATSTNREKATKLLESVGVIDYFQGMVCGDDIVNSKPNPEIFLKAAGELNIHPKECMVLEDSGAGIAAAHAAGMLPINIPDMKKPDEDMFNKSYRIYRSLLNVIDLLKDESQIYTIENEFIKATISTRGGEIHTITNKKNNRNILWNGRKFGWNASATTLFPIIGNVKNGEIKVDNKKYNLKEHGFISYYNHELLKIDENKIKLKFNYNEDTLNHFPYKFSVETYYELYKNELKIAFSIQNIDNKDIYFSLGSHPYFNCPFSKEDSFNNYYLEFDTIENTNIFKINKDDLLTGEEALYLNNTNKLKLTEDTFKNGTLIFKNLKSKSVTLKSDKNHEEIKINIGNFKYLSLWALENKSPFICIEPWFGHADYKDFNGEFKDKEGTIKLEKNEEYTLHYSIMLK